MSSFHCEAPRQLSLADLDPSLAVGFYARTQEEFAALLQAQPPLHPHPHLGNNRGTLQNLKELSLVVETEGGGQRAPPPLFSVLDRPHRPHSPVQDPGQPHAAALHHGFELL